MTPRAPGWYWLQDSSGVWEPAEYALTPEVGYCWWYRSAWYHSDQALGCKIGPRLRPPSDAAAPMVERVRHAIKNRGDELRGQGLTPLEGVGELAVAAIEAMREPTQAMLLAGFRGTSIASMWRRMVDEALAPPLHQAAADGAQAVEKRG